MPVDFRFSNMMYTENANKFCHIQDFLGFCFMWFYKSYKLTCEDES